MKRKCKLCGEKKDRIKGPKRKLGHIFTDKLGRWWDRTFCPDCAEAEGPDMDLDPPTSRLCRHCGTPLRTSRYFHCERCTTPTPNTKNSRNYDCWSGDEYGYGAALSGGSY